MGQIVSKICSCTREKQVRSSERIIGNEVEEIETVSSSEGGNEPKENEQTYEQTDTHQTHIPDTERKSSNTELSEIYSNPSTQVPGSTLERHEPDEQHGNSEMESSHMESPETEERTPKELLGSINEQDELNGHHVIRSEIPPSTWPELDNAYADERSEKKGGRKSSEGENEPKENEQTYEQTDTHQTHIPDTERKSSNTELSEIYSNPSTQVPGSTLERHEPDEQHGNSEMESSHMNLPEIMERPPKELLGSINEQGEMNGQHVIGSQVPPPLSEQGNTYADERLEKKGGRKSNQRRPASYSVTLTPQKPIMSHSYSAGRTSADMNRGRNQIFPTQTSTTPEVKHGKWVTPDAFRTTMESPRKNEDKVHVYPSTIEACQSALKDKDGEINSLMLRIQDLTNTEERHREDIRKKDILLQQLEGKVAKARKDELGTRHREDIRKKDILLQQLEGKVAQTRNDELGTRHREDIRKKDILLQQLEVKVAQLTARNEELGTRLSALAGARLTTNNPNITDLSDSNRPDKLADKFSELYDNEWTDAFEAIEKINQHSSGVSSPTTDLQKDIIEGLLKLLTITYQTCYDQAAKEMEELKTTYQTVCKEEIPIEVQKQLNDKRKRVYEDDIKRIKPKVDEVTQQFVKNVWKLGYTEEIQVYTNKCLEICWLMAIQDPPVYIDSEIEQYLSKKKGRFNKELFKEYTKGGPKIDFVVWPVLYLYKGGPILHKGVAQGKGKKKRKGKVGPNQESTITVVKSLQPEENSGETSDLADSESHSC